MIAESVIFPSTDQLLATAGRRAVTSTALLKLRDGTIWMLKAVGHAWTDRRIDMAATIALANENEGISRVWPQIFASSLAMPSLIIVDAASAHVMPEQWGVHEFSSSVCGNQEGCFEKVESSIEATLTDVLKSFFSALNPQAKLHAISGSEIDIRIYNYLIHRKHGRYRMQFAATFPLLLPEIAKAMQKGEEEIILRRAIDSGVPFVRELANVWEVSPRVIRHIIGKTPSVVGERWVGNAKGLARILDALPQEFLPGDDPWQWLQFNRAVSRAHKLSHVPLWKSPAALAWLRESASCWLCPEADGSAPVMQGTGLITSGERLQELLGYILTLEVEERHAGLPSNRGPRVTQAVDDLMLSILRKGRLPQVVARFDREIGQSVAAQPMEFSLLLGGAYWPLFPGEFISSDGLRKVVTLTEAKGFRVHAQLLNICLWSNTDYIARCRHGKSFVLAFLDMVSGVPKSTAEISLVHHVSGRRWDLQVNQHTGPGNKPVTDQCAQALTEVLRYCNTMEVRRHIERGQQLIADIEREGKVWARRQADIAQFAPVLRAALGNAVYKAAIHRTYAALNADI